MNAEYVYLREHAPDVFWECVRAAEAIAHNHNLGVTEAAAIEGTLIGLAVKVHRSGQREIQIMTEAQRQITRTL